MITVSFINIKGGVAKTTSAIAFATLLAKKKKKRVLLLDCDKQGDATTAFIDKSEITGLTTADLLLNKNADIHDAIIHPKFEVDIIPADFNLIEANFKLLFETTSSREFKLKNHFTNISEEYDYCIIDCPPDINMSITNALIASDYVLIPVSPDKNGFDGLNRVFTSVNEARESNPKLKIAGCFLTRTKRDTALFEGTDELLSKFGVYAMKTNIRNSTKVGESSFTTPLVISAPRSTAAKDYTKLLNEFLERINTNV